MPVPSERDIQVPLLHLIHDMGGEVKPNDAYNNIADYFGLTEKERQQMQPSGISRRFDNKVAWTRSILCSQSFLDGSIHGIWKITEKGRRELSRLGLIDKAFPRTTSLPGQAVLTSTKGEKEPKSDDEEILELVLEEIAPGEPRQFPHDFLDKKNRIDFYEVNVPRTQLHLAPLSKTIITSPRRYFRYQAKNPLKLSIFFYAHNVGSEKVRIPKDNLTLFRTVKTYEKYCDGLTRRAFELFLEFTYDEDKSQQFTREVAARLKLKGKLPILGDSRG